MGKTQPIKKADDVQRLKEYYLEKKQIRNYTMVTLALNTSLRISDLLHLKWIDVYNFKTHKYREHINLVEQKTGKQDTDFMRSAPHPHGQNQHDNYNADNGNNYYPDAVYA